MKSLKKLVLGLSLLGALAGEVSASAYHDAQAEAAMSRASAAGRTRIAAKYGLGVAAGATAAEIDAIEAGAATHAAAVARVEGVLGGAGTIFVRAEAARDSVKAGVADHATAVAEVATVLGGAAGTLAAKSTTILSDIKSAYLSKAADDILPLLPNPAGATGRTDEALAAAIEAVHPGWFAAQGLGRTDAGGARYAARADLIDAAQGGLVAALRVAQADRAAAGGITALLDAVTVADSAGVVATVAKADAVSATASIEAALRAAGYIA